MSRSRWAAVGAAVAVSVGGGGLLTASAAPEAGGEASSTIAIVPCRFLDTRLSTSERTTPFGGGETVDLAAFGTHGGCTIPVDATALVANVTTVNQSDGGYLTMFPAGAERPTISVLNWAAGDGATGNEVTMKLSAAGSFSVFNFAGTTDVVIDVVAYLVPASSGIGPKGDTGDTGQTGAVGPQGEIGLQGEPGVRHRATRATSAVRVTPVFRACRAIPVFRACRVILVPRACRVIPVPRASRASRATPASRPSVRRSPPQRERSTIGNLLL